MTQAKLLISPDCQYCSSMMELLGSLLKEGKISRLLMVNIAEQPGEAEKHNVRSVPWLMIGKLEFIGAQSKVEIEKAIEMAESEDGQQIYLMDQLKNGRLNEVAALVEKDKSVLVDVLALLALDDIVMSVRIGVSAIVEGFEQDQQTLKSILPQLLDLSFIADESIRTDVCHFLSLVDDEAAVNRLKQCLDDTSGQVREVVVEALAE